jgi:hypothetical protein
MMNLIEENYRLPLVSVADTTRTRLKEVLLKLGLLKEATHVAA